MDFTRILPEECQALIISLTSPEDACRSAMVSPSLRSVADSDAVWEKFLPCDYHSIVSSSSSSSLLSLGKKDLYFHLSSHLILVQNDTMSFQLEKRSGKKWYMLGARALSIIWGDTPAYWIWTSQPDSRFPEVAELKLVWWLDVKGKIETRILSPNTNYAIYLVFRLRYRHTSGFRRRTVGLNVNIDGMIPMGARRVSLDSRDEPQHLRERGDEWMEVEMGEFWNECGDGGSVEFCLKEIDTNFHKRGLIIEGIEIRPKDIVPSS
ncbi:F-box family protein [Hibiscus syriacus]|uniref:F-box family protein n=1 Tax=Hibiscus syriacus TaxID=106335 RepID=A0A6A2XW99_HIBSY|nr:putative F-box protein PP2-B12 [Hibiscus syriacus]KAE8658454.1 F-box family protein [Hibiscus syriacus]